MFLTIMGNPMSKHRPRFGKGRTYTPKETVSAEDNIKRCALAAGPHDIIDGPVRARLTFDMKIPKTWSKKKKEQAELGIIRPVTGKDFDNMAKLVCDSLNKIAYNDDSQIVEAMIIKKYSAEPKTIILIEGI